MALPLSLNSTALSGTISLGGIRDMLICLRLELSLRGVKRFLNVNTQDSFLRNEQ